MLLEAQPSPPRLSPKLSHARNCQKQRASRAMAENFDNEMGVAEEGAKPAGDNGACDYKTNFASAAEETRLQTALLQSMHDSKVIDYERRQLVQIGEGSEAAAERQIALLEALNNRVEAALLNEERETKA